jgi:ApbE superfamily uncharacterized protein (UPF0280 family)
MSPGAAWLSANRLHLQHGPIDLVIGCDGTPAAQRRAFGAARDRFATILDDLVTELPLLRAPLGPEDCTPRGRVAARMVAATQPFATRFITPMAAAAGAVADEVLQAMTGAAALSRAYVNNGGDIALHLSPGEGFHVAICDHGGAQLGRVAVGAGDGIGGLATSGRHGRSLSRGIADSVTALASCAAAADAAATMIANAVDLPGHPAIRRVPADTLDPDSDLGARPVVCEVGPLTRAETEQALQAGRAAAEGFARAGLISGAAMMLEGATEVTGTMTRIAAPMPA